MWQIPNLLQLGYIPELQKHLGDIAGALSRNHFTLQGLSLKSFAAPLHPKGNFVKRNVSW
jgi:hypothetical protein